MRDVICGTGQLALQQRQVGNLQVPLWKELAMKKMWNRTKNNRYLIWFLPRSWNERTAERLFFWGILFALFPQYCIDIIEDVRRQRYERKSRAQQREPIEIAVTAEWKEAL